MSPLNLAHSDSPFRKAPVHYHAPPLVNASLAFSAIYLVGALVQLGLITISVARTKSFRPMAPMIITVTALVFSMIGYALNITSIVVLYTDNRFGYAKITMLGWARLQVATTIFEEWPEFLLLAAVVCFLRDRYCVHSGRYAKARRSRTIPIVMVLALLTIFLVFFPIIFNVLWEKLYTTHFTSLQELHNAENIYLGTYYVYIGSYVLASICVCALSIVLKRIASSDPILKILLNIIVPLLSLRAIARIVFVIVNARVSSNNMNELVITFFNWLILDGLYLAATSILVVCLIRPHWWTGVREHILMENTRLEGAASDANFDAHWPQRFPSEAITDMKPPSSPY